MRYTRHLAWSKQSFIDAEGGSSHGKKAQQKKEHKGDSVVVPKADGTISAGVVKTVERHMKVMVPQSIEDTPKIVSKI